MKKFNRNKRRRTDEQWRASILIVSMKLTTTITSTTEGENNWSLTLDELRY